MKYISTYAPICTSVQPTTVFLSEDDNAPQLDDTTVEEVFRSARTTLGGGFQLNPVRGQTAEKYYFTQMRNSFYSRSACTADDNTVLAAALRTGEDLASLASDGQSTEWTIFDYAVSEYIYIYPLKRNFVINPGIGHTEMRVPPFVINRGSSARWATYSVDSYAGDYGSAPVKVTYSQDVNSRGNYTISPVFTLADTMPLFDSVYATRFGTSSSGQSVSWNNNEVTDSFHSTEHLFDDELVNIHFGLFPISETLLWRFERGVDFTVDDDLVPGTRPYIQFKTTHTEL